MPLLDHFHPPLAQIRHWESFHAAWASTLADALNDGLLPPGYFAEELITVGGRIEIDVATWQDRDSKSSDNGSTAVATRVWSPPTPTTTMPAVFPDTFAVKVYSSEGGPKLVASVELVSPGNKDRESHRRAFTSKCGSYLHQGNGLVVVDIVTSRRANLHNELIDLLHQDAAFKMKGEIHLYATAYRPVLREERGEIDIWMEALALGQTLPTMPLALAGSIFVPLDLEGTYTDVCRRRLID